MLHKAVITLFLLLMGVAAAADHYHRYAPTLSDGELERALRALQDERALRGGGAATVPTLSDPPAPVTSAVKTPIAFKYAHKKTYATADPIKALQ